MQQLLAVRAQGWQHRSYDRGSAEVPAMRLPDPLGRVLRGLLLVGRSCPPLCAQCGTPVLFRYSHADKNIYDRECACPRAERPEYEATADEVDRMRRWFADNWVPVSEDFARFALTSVAELLDGTVASTSFEDRDGAVATVTPHIARRIITKGA